MCVMFFVYSATRTMMRFTQLIKPMTQPQTRVWHARLISKRFSIILKKNVK